MEDTRARIPAIWWDDRDPDPEAICSSTDTELVVQYDTETIYIDGLRDGFYLSIDLKDLFAAMAGTAGGEAEVFELEREAALSLP
jgi:myo-inositol-hexaphosphate 3-phosphohydrolase